MGDRRRARTRRPARVRPPRSDHVLTRPSVKLDLGFGLDVVEQADAYGMPFAGELDGGPGRDGMVYFGEASIERCIARRGFGVVADSSTASVHNPKVADTNPAPATKL